MYREIAVAERGHEERYAALAKNVEEGKVFKKDTEVVWQCRNCGYLHVGTEAPGSLSGLSASASLLRSEEE